MYKSFSFTMRGLNKVTLIGNLGKDRSGTPP